MGKEGSSVSIGDGLRRGMRTALRPAARIWGRLSAPHVGYPPDFSPDDIALCAAVGPYTMTGPERIVALADAVRYVTQNDVPGCVVECGVWRGGSMMVVAKTLLAAGAADRELYLFDTFEGMPPPTPADRDAHGTLAAEVLARTRRTADHAPRSDDFSKWALSPANATFNMWCIADEADVTANLRATGYPMDRVHLVRGRVEETIPARAPDTICLLRLDTDWYESTRHELEHLYDRLVPGGVLMIDDYGHWQGARQAVDEFLARVRPVPLLHRIDFTGRCAIKPSYRFKGSESLNS